MSRETPQEFVIARTLDAPRPLVYSAWTDPAHLAQWMSPAGCSTLRCTLDLKPGGTYHYGLRTPDGGTMWGKWNFREIAAPERLVFVSHFSDEKGGVTRHPMSASWPLYTLSTITFAEQGKGTLLTIRWLPLEATDEEVRTFNAAHAGMMQGWGGTMAQLEAFLAQARRGGA